MPPDSPVEQLVKLDEGFQLRIADMARNTELHCVLVNLNERIRFIRWIDMEKVGRDSTQKEHDAVLKALKARDAVVGERLLREHIGLRQDQVVDSITRGLAKSICVTARHVECVAAGGVPNSLRKVGVNAGSLLKPTSFAKRVMFKALLFSILAEYTIPHQPR